MKNIIKSTFKVVASLLVFGVIMLMPACNDNPDAFVVAEGVPVISYVRLPDALKSDSLLTHAFMGSTIAIMGENLRSVNEVWFNDQKSILNTSLMTSTTLIVVIPTVIPTSVTNKMYLVTLAGDTVKYDFGVDVPAPMINSMKCEQVSAGEVATIYGDFFLDDPNKPLEVIFPGNIKASHIISIAKTKIEVEVPVGAQRGQLNVKSLYGNGRSSFWFRDNRGIILDWDNTNANGGWRSGKIGNSNPAGIDGNYVRFKGALDAAAEDGWAEDDFSFNLWGAANGRSQGDLFSIDPSTAVLKFEVNVVSAWSSHAMQLIFTPWATSGTNGYIADGTTPRALWIPWKATGTYQTDGWETITIPIKDFKYAHDGKLLEMASAGHYGGLTFFVYHGGSQADGTACTPEICIDNIRVVPAE